MDQKSFNEIKNALKKTIHTLIDLDFEEGKLDGAVKQFLDAERLQINLTFQLHPNDVVFIRNLTNNKVPRRILSRVKKLRNNYGA